MTLAQLVLLVRAREPRVTAKAGRGSLADGLMIARAAKKGA